MVACEEESIRQETLTARDQQQRFLDTQPVPIFEWSQLRQNLIEIETAMARTTQTTSFFFNLGVANPISQCPSIGYPIPATFQLTNPFQAVTNGAVIAQMESTGVYTGETSGTHVLCVASSGKAYDSYWEGFVYTVTGAAEWRDGQAVLIGEPTVDFTIGRPEETTVTTEPQG
jgi:hypothetical protein